MKMKTLCYNVVLPIVGVIDVSDNATDEEIENAICEDACDASSYRSTWKGMEVTDINDITKGA